MIGAPIAAPAGALDCCTTPLERLGSNWVKREGRQPSGSVKLRLVAERLRLAQAAGELSPERPLVELTAGSTGVALAWAGRQLGLAVEVHCLEGACEHKLARMRALGAELVLHPAESAVPALVEALRERHRGGHVWHLDQYRRARLIEGYRPLATELLEQLAEARVAPSALVCPIGTGGLIQGLAGPLRERYPSLQVVAIEPAPGQAIDGLRNTAQFHGGEDDPYDRELPDRRVEVEAPPRRRLADGAWLGASASACLRWIEAEGLRDALVVAADERSREEGGE